MIGRITRAASIGAAVAFVSSLYTGALADRGPLTGYLGEICAKDTIAGDVSNGKVTRTVEYVDTAAAAPFARPPGVAFSAREAGR